MQKRTNYYQSKNHSCGKIMHIYDKKTNNIYNANCKQFSCGYCRQIEIGKLLRKVVRTAKHNNLTRHVVITIGGDNIRKYINPDQSFNYVSKMFNLFRVKYKLKFGHNLPYISFRRSHEDGYCHIHALVGDFIDKNKLQDLALECNLGYTRIDFVSVNRIGRYLSKYWYKDHEWYIPKGKKHITKSRDFNWIELKHNDKLVDFEPSGCLEYDRYQSDSKRYHIIMKISNIKNKSYLDYIYEYVYFLSGGYPPSFSFMLANSYQKARGELT